MAKWRACVTRANMHVNNYIIDKDTDDMQHNYPIID